MPGYARDLATLEPWEASLARSRARRRRAAVRARRRGRGATLTALARGGWDPISLAALIDARREARDLAETEPWELSLGRSRARRRAAQLRFVPASSRAKRLSLGALVALTAGAGGAASALLDSGGAVALAAGTAELDPITTTRHQIVLSRGDEGRQVRLLQRALGINVDGIFGSETEAAVRRFQATRGLVVDGIVGAHTSHALAAQAPPTLSGAAVLRDLSGVAHEAAPGEVSEASGSGALDVSAGGNGAASNEAAGLGADEGSAEAAGTGGTAAEGAGAVNASETATTPARASWELASNEGTGVEAAESAATGGTAIPAGAGATGEYETPAILEGVGAASGDGEGGASDGDTGEGERTGTGAAETGTRGVEATSAEGQSAVEGQHSAGTTRARAEQAADGEERTTVTAVRRIQAALSVAVDGEFGPETEHAIRAFQAAHGLAVDGIAGPQTWDALGEHGQPELTPPPSALPARPVGRLGDGGGADGRQPGAGDDMDVAVRRGPARIGFNAAVRRLQEALHVAVDGEFGPETEGAVRRFQSEHGLEVDGVAGPQTWGALGEQGMPELNPPRGALAGTGSGGASSSAGGSAPGATSSSAEAIVARVIAAADEIATRPYVYGGGHGSFISEGYDCSGSVSYALHGGGLLSSPEDSTALESYGEPGPGRYITIYANAEHAWMTIDGRRFDTVALAEDGSRWGGPSDDGGGFVERHPSGL
jgi:peptidoglycan hydrolase-like protein with peptidoglycan-binding domain